jgi:pimeloyl-ACP methyl ester carboxylesterase
VLFKYSITKENNTVKNSLIFYIALGIALALMVTGLMGLSYINQNFVNQQFVTFTDPQGDELVGTYLPGTVEMGVLMLEGFGSDQIAMRPATSILRAAGAHIFTFDFSGHGQSPGGLGFDNAATDRLAYQVLAAKETFQDQSGLADDQIILFGHSMGARVALQSTILDPYPPAALVLLGTQVNLGTNRQAAFFTGTDDADLAWVQSLSAQIPKTHILLLSGSWDDILTPAAAQALQEKLLSESESGENNYSRRLTIIPNLFHNYEIYSARLFKQAVAQLQELGLLDFHSPISLTNYYVFGALTLLGLLGSLTALAIGWQGPHQASPMMTDSVKITDVKKFLRAKLILWLPALLVALLLTGVFFLIPLYLPVFNMVYVGFIAGYGILMLVLYRLGKVPGTQGKLALHETREPSPPLLKEDQFWIGLTLWVVILGVCILFTRSGLFYVIPANHRLAWLLIFSPFTAIGFWIGDREARLVSVFRKEADKRLPWVGILHPLIGLMPFILYAIFMGVLGSTSGMIGGLQGLLILVIVLLTGKALTNFIRKFWLISILQAVLLYALVLPQGVLFSF